MTSQGMTQEKRPYKELLKSLWFHLSPRRRFHLLILLCLLMVASFAEILSIGAIIPFLGVLTAPEKVYNHKFAEPIISLLNISSPEELLLPLTILFGIAALLSGGMRLIMLWANTRLSFATGSDLCVSIYRRTLYQPYSIHVSRNSSEVIAAIANKTNLVIYSVLLPIMNLISYGAMMIAIVGMLVYVEPFFTLVTFAVIGLIYFIIIRMIKRKLQVISKQVSKGSSLVVKYLQEGLGGIRDILIDGSQNTYCNVYQGVDSSFRRAQGEAAFIGGCPRFTIEAIGMVIIAMVAYLLSRQPDGLAKAIPILGVMVFGAQRALPIVQQLYSAWANIQSSEEAFRDTMVLLEQPLPKYIESLSIEPMPFKNHIRINKLSFRYAPDLPDVISDVDITIAKGSMVGFIGETGCGKSTLLDLIMGLLEPTGGDILVDQQIISSENRRNWQLHIAHVPQVIFLSDSSIAENIAFGLPREEIDSDRVKVASERAQLLEMIESLPQQFNTPVGERGVKLSGGQRQRIGIARALYKNADVIIFDEATSALDNETERAVMESIQSLDDELTILIIAHRLSTLKKCDRIIELGNGGINRIGTYSEIVGE